MGACRSIGELVLLRHHNSWAVAAITSCSQHGSEENIPTHKPTIALGNTVKLDRGEMKDSVHSRPVARAHPLTSQTERKANNDPGDYCYGPQCKADRTLHWR